MCVTVCTPSSGGNSFLITGAANTAIVGTGADNLCYYDFLAIAGGFNPANGFAADRYCGGALSPVVGTAAPGNTVCSKL